jgi:hypothetical protein
VTLAGNLQIQTRLPELLHHQMNRVSRGSRYPSAISMSAVESAQLQSEIICNQSIIIIVCVHVCSSQMRANGPPSKFEILDPRNGQIYHIQSIPAEQISPLAANGNVQETGDRKEPRESATSA